MNTITGGTSREGNVLHVEPYDPCPGCPQGCVCKTPECGRLKSSGWVEPTRESRTGMAQPELHVSQETFWVAEIVVKGGSLYVTAPHERYPFMVTETADISSALRFADAESCQRFIDWQYPGAPPDARPVARGHQWMTP